MLARLCVLLILLPFCRSQDRLEACDQANPCVHGGSCIKNNQRAVAYQCLCPPEYTGDVCEKRNTNCDGNRCQNGGTCEVEQNNSYFCYCLQMYRGTNCEINQSCDLRPCQNGGYCTLTPNSYKCKCAEAFAGRDCQFPASPCSKNNPCENDMECIPDMESHEGYRCLCKYGWEGQNCDQGGFEPCIDAASLCFNGASCVENLKYEPPYICVCPPGFEGDDCKGVKKSCSQDPCINGGECHEFNYQRGFRCSCFAPYEGKFCEIDTHRKVEDPINRDYDETYYEESAWDMTLIFGVIAIYVLLVINAGCAVGCYKNWDIATVELMRHKSDPTKKPAFCDIFFSAMEKTCIGAMCYCFKEVGDEQWYEELGDHDEYEDEAPPYGQYDEEQALIGRRDR